jgi:hypothetical protein
LADVGGYNAVIELDVETTVVDVPPLVEMLRMLSPDE